MPPIARPWLAAALVPAALLAACGGGTTPAEVAYEYVTTNTPAKCDLLVPELLERQTGRTGPAARAYCAENVGLEQPPAEARVAEAEIVGGTAKVELVIDQTEERVELVQRDGEWRISAFPR